ncbi:threonine aldolase family protein [Actinacidiphila sp. ITFR-21]|uniref:threonine aldolase family protein n=1 Tax=Actinacidiphila sp. ITFR-21 TaxID=3075199 RepID=UPI00288B0DBA|nr:beta-eliminating lyase-related protein [Streptomyces sp. ITFR-21]WNI17084.1 beta-eliminating lyase-related protein [Streptomyces sp. ITFR-21]
MDEGEKARRQAAVRACGPVLTGRWSDTVRERAGWLAAVAEELTEADEAPDVYGDGVVRRLEEEVARLLGVADAAFFPTGTMAQQVALRAWAGRTGNHVVALHPLAHPEVHERGALQAVTGLRTVYPTREPRLATAEEIRGFEEPFGTLMLELPLRDAGFVLPTWDELTETVAAARGRDAVVHFDGARLWESAPHFGRSLPEIAALADSVYVSFYKSLRGLSGAALGGSAELVAEAKAWRHRYGGLVHQQFPAALAALAGLRDELPRLPSYVAHAGPVARALREGLAAGGLDRPRIHPAEPHTHQFQLWLPYPAAVLDEASLRQAEQTRTSLFGRGRFAGSALPGMSMIEVTVSADALEWTEQDVREAAASFARLVTAVEAAPA